MRFGSIASGSSGNCVYAGLGGKHFLIDAGVSGKKIAAGLAHFGVARPDGIFVTHEHADHAQALGIMARRYDVPIYATPLTWRYFLRHGTLGHLPAELMRHVQAGESFCEGDVRITPFTIPHDAAEPVGYTLEADGGKIAIVTDLGEATPAVQEHLRGADIICIESNHDMEMLRNGRYPPVLKRRVMSTRGHLSNAACGVLLVEVCEGLPPTRLPHVFLAHLSEENNRPMLAYDTVLRVLDGNGAAVRRLTVAERGEPGDLLEI